jgi:ACS family tartrate transporter-like MFS transporter
MPALSALVPPLGVDPAAVRLKVAWRLLPLLFVLYVISYLDRANVGFAKLRMQAALDWSDEIFGLGFGVFFAGYLLLEIPGALIVEHGSARKWFCRILVTWGVCSMAMAFVQTEWQFYLARFLLGLAEAGFFPGVIVYLTHWFPRADRARALSGLVLGVPFSLALGARVSGYLLDQTWFDYAGWQLVFLIEGFPAVLMGVLVPFLMTDRPRDARWLTPDERTWLEESLQQERDEAAKTGAVSLGQALRQPTVWLLALGILATNTGGYAMVFWLPSFVENLLKAQGEGFASSDVLNGIGMVYLFGIAGVFLSGQSSDRLGDRKWHCVFGQVMTGVCLAASVIPGQPTALVWTWLAAMGFFAFFWPSPFWALPTMSLSASAAAVAIGIVNICANLAGLLGSPVVGQLKTWGYSDAVCLVLLASTYVLGGVVISFVRVSAKKPVVADEVHAMEEPAKA